MVMFTGSTETGKKVLERAARTLTPVSLELGGKDPMIVLADADVERAANTAVYASMQNGGQTCVSIERVYVEAPVYDDFVDRVTRKVAALRQGVPDGPGSVDVGAITFAPQLDVVSRHVEEARRPARACRPAGAPTEDGGRFYAPTVIADADHTMSCMTEETFGPTVAIMRVADADEAVRLANDSPYGLSASVFGKDVARAEAGRAPRRGRRRVRQRRAAQLLRARAADGRLEGVRHGLAPRRARASASTAASSRS